MDTMTMVESIRIREIQGETDRSDAVALIREYLAEIGVEIAIRGFESEIPSFPGKFSPPEGGILLARDKRAEAVGCVSFQPLQPGKVEIKRLYVRSPARRRGTARQLMIEVIALAAARGYSRILLDSMPQMQAALALYASMGFKPTKPYWDNAVPGILYYELSIAI